MLHSALPVDIQNSLLEVDHLLRASAQGGQKSNCQNNQASHGYFKVSLILSILSSNASRPKPVSDEVRNIGGSSSHNSSNAFFIALILAITSRCFSLSVLVKTIDRGIPLVPRKVINSRSILCGVCDCLSTHRHLSTLRDGGNNRASWCPTSRVRCARCGHSHIPGGRPDTTHR